MLIRFHGSLPRRECSSVQKSGGIAGEASRENRAERPWNAVNLGLLKMACSLLQRIAVQDDLRVPKGFVTEKVSPSGNTLQNALRTQNSRCNSPGH
jgi:hypothetical protein